MNVRVLLMVAALALAAAVGLFLGHGDGTFEGIGTIVSPGYTLVAGDFTVPQEMDLVFLVLAVVGDSEAILAHCELHVMNLAGNRSPIAVADGSVNPADDLA